MKNRILIIVALALISLTGCQTTSNYLSTEQIKSKYKKVMLFTYYEDGLAPFYEKIDDFYQPKIDALMVKHSITTIKSDAYFARIKKLKIEMNYQEFDPNTGKKNSAQYRQIQKLAKKQLKKELNIDGFMHYGVSIEKADFSSGGLSFMAKWDGAAENYLVGGAGAGDVLASFFVTESGTTSGLSFFILFSDENSVTDSEVRGGIELLSLYDDAQDKFIIKPVEELLDEEDKMQFGFDRAAKILNGKK